ncbi:MAG: FtsK/SpoIIIE domain-containing protein, partial [Planctomycetia bacterium]
MTESHPIERQNKLLTGLGRLIADRLRQESAADLEVKTKLHAAEKEFEQAKAQINARYQKVRSTTESEYATVVDRHQTEFAERFSSTEREFEDVLKKTTERYETSEERIARECKDATWTATTLFDATRGNAETERTVAKSRINSGVQKVKAMYAETTKLLETLGQPEMLEETVAALGDKTADDDEKGESDDPPAEGESADAEAVPTAEKEISKFEKAIADAESRILAMRKLSLPKLAGLPLYGTFIGLGLVGAGGSFLVVDPKNQVLALGISAGVAVFGALIGGIVVSVVATSQIRGLLRKLVASLEEARTLRKKCIDEANADFRRARAGSKKVRDNDVGEADRKYKKFHEDFAARRDRDLKAAEEKYPFLLEQIQKKLDDGLAEAEAKYPKRLTDLETAYKNELKAAQEKYTRDGATAKSNYQQSRLAVADHWKKAIEEGHAESQALWTTVKQYFPDWNDPVWASWQPPKSAAPMLPFGRMNLKLSMLGEPGAANTQWMQADGSRDFATPAMTPFPGGASMVFRAADYGRTVAAELLQTLMLRLLTSVPPGKVKFTIVDPVGLGQNFAAFMHLTEYDDTLVASRIWTEPQHIEQRLVDLTIHIENVIQKYLRNEFKTIEEYNAQAGEVSEPFRVLVVANFPAGFSDNALNRLKSIMISGPRCGVYTMMMVDMKLPMPAGVNLSDYESQSNVLLWKDDKYSWRKKEFADFPLSVDSPPDQDFFTKTLHVVGEKAKGANRVEVPFEIIIPPAEKWWKADTRRGVDVPVGRAGANRLQNFRLGSGTSQHVLLAGKTGSGKSTLLHALICNLALTYSPDQCEMYLIDFKKGVEFKTYAAFGLPHARVIAVESEREFGLSVMQRLDVELRARGEKFREHNCQDLRAYRETPGTPPLPRILFIVDEFQEFFTEDDKIAQEAALLLDRLVRQGRAFGIHVVLGSQTLGGAFTVSRATLSQMAVRIALQCSEADSHLILSEDNGAARLLGRPGEAIYNDQNGMIEGNSLFQVVWLSDERKDHYLKRIQDLMKQYPPVLEREQIVFEGNIPAVADENHQVAELLAATNWPAAGRVVQAWVGDAIAIKDPTAIPFRRQSGANVLICGQNDEMTLGVFSMMMVSLAAQHAPADRRADALLRAAQPAAAAAEPAKTEDLGGMSSMDLSSSLLSLTSGDDFDAPAKPAAGKGPTAPLFAPGTRFFIFDGGINNQEHAGLFTKLAEVLPHPVSIAFGRETNQFVADLAAEVERRSQTGAPDQAAIYLFVYDLQRFRDLRKADDDYGFSRDAKPSPSKLFAQILKEGPSVGVHAVVWCDSWNNLSRTFERSALREFELRVLYQMSATDSSNLIDVAIA